MSTYQEREKAKAVAYAERDPAAFSERLVKNLNDKQREAVLYPHESLLVLAGAGSGKTTVLIGRIANLVNEGIPARKILSVTFTNKASEEMKKRLNDKMTREDVNSIWAGTFHSVCNRMLREDYEAAGLPRNFAILDTDSQESLIKTITKDRNAAFNIEDLKSIERDPSSDKSDDDVSGGVEKITAKDVVNYINSKKEFGIKPYQIDAFPGSREEVFVTLYDEYERACKAQGLLDFNDLLYRTVELLEQNHDIRAKYHERFAAILIDEFQDTNDIQYRWLRLIKSPSTFVTAVGDDDQSIYAFRGANPKNMRLFVEEMTATPASPYGAIVKLEQNYRSLPYILNAANAIISTNTNRLGKNLWSGGVDRGEKIILTEFESGTAEAAVVAKKVHSLIHERKVQPKEIAVLYRTNMQSRGIETEINKLGIPATVYGGFRFYERQEIKHVLAYMDLVSNFTRDISFARVVNFPQRGIGDRTVEDLRQDARAHNLSMMEMIGMRAERGISGVTAASVKKQAALEKFAFMILDLTDASVNMSLSELVEEIVQKTGMMTYYDTLPSEESAERKSNIEELVSAAKQFELDHPGLGTAIEQMPEYLSFVQLMTSTSKASMDELNTVSLMSVHSSKGLEFDYVFLTGLEEGLFPHQRSIGDNDGKRGPITPPIVEEYDDDGELTDETIRKMQERLDAPENNIDSDEMQEECRIMYVATTRPRKHLEITYAKTRMSNGEIKTQKPSRFLERIPENLIAKVIDPSMKNLYGGKPKWPAKTPVKKNDSPSAPAIEHHKHGLGADTAKTFNKTSLFK